MASKSMFKSSRGRKAPAADTINLAGGLAYGLSSEQALAQFALTGCLGPTFYATGEQQLSTALQLAQKCDVDFIARLAVYARKRGYMKDMPALLCAVLAVEAPELLKKVFFKVMDDARMLRNFVQIVRSGVTGRKSLGSLPKRLVREWIGRRTCEQLFVASVGNDPSLADVIKMVHPKPSDAQRTTMYAYLIGKPCEDAHLPELVQEYERFKVQRKGAVPDVPMQMLTHLDLGVGPWKDIAKRAPWQATRMNLNTFLRHNVFTGTDGKEIAHLIADRLRNPELVARSRVFPYQLMVAYLQIEKEIPNVIKQALQDAMEIAIGNVPEIEGKVYVFCDVSGSMQSPVTGHRPGATSVVRCVDVAALVSAAVLRKNGSAEVVPFSDHVIKCQLNPRDSVMTNAKTLASLPAGGTNCSAPMRMLNERKADADLIIYVSDNESWMDSHPYWPQRATETAQQWESLKQRCPKAKLVCIDLTPNTTTQAKSRKDVLNVGGFSDQVFDVIASFARDEASADYWVDVIKSTELQMK